MKTIFPGTDEPFLREATTRKVRQPLEASTLGPAYAARDGLDAQRFFVVFPEETFVPSLLEKKQVFETRSK